MPTTPPDVDCAAALNLTDQDPARRLGIDDDRVIEWRKGATSTGGEVWHIMRMALPAPENLSRKGVPETTWVPID